MTDKAETADERQVITATMIAWREARDATRVGTKEYQSLDEEYRKAEAAYYKLADQS